MESSVRLRYEGRSTYGNLATTLTGNLEIFILYLACQISNRQHILISFIGQTYHKVQLNAVPAGFKCCTDSIHQILFCYALVDNITHLLAACFRSKGQTALTHCLYLLGDSNTEAVDTQRRQRNADAFILKLANHLMYQRSQAGIIGAGKGYQADFIIACVIYQLTRQVHQHLRLALTHGAVNHACMAETAATAAATENLQHDAVMNNFTERNNRRCREIYAVHILYNTLLDNSRNILAQRLNCLKGAVLIIFCFIEGRYINTLDFYHTLQKFLSAAGFAFTLPLLVATHYLDQNLFAFTDNSKIEEISQRLRVVHTGAAYNNKGVCISTVLSQQRHATQIKHI